MIPRSFAVWALLLAAAALAPRALAAEAAPDCEGRALAEGLCLSTELTADGFANLRGGARRGLTGFGRLGLALEADLDQMAGLQGWQAGLTILGLYGRPAASLSGSMAAPSNAEALSTLRLQEAWLERRVAGLGGLRFGLLAADSEFATADAAETLVNATFGWPVGLSENLPAGGVAYPLAAPGVRLELGQPEERLGLRLGLFSGDPGGRYAEDTDPQRHNRYGLNPSFAGGAFLIAELVLGAPAPEEGGPRPWVLKLGGWRHTGGFDSQRRDAMGRSLADAASSGLPRRYGHDQGAYAIAEATLWRGEGQSLAGFARGFLAPADRNLVGNQVDAGLAWKGPFGREEDTLALGLSRAGIGGGARGLDRDLRTTGWEDWPLRRAETLVELNYDLALAAGPHLRPGVQWIRNPGGAETRDALLLGLRVQASF